MIAHIHVSQLYSFTQYMGFAFFQQQKHPKMKEN